MSFKINFDIKIEGKPMIDLYNKTDTFYVKCPHQNCHFL